MTDRRQFLRGALAVAVGACLPPLPEPEQLLTFKRLPIYFGKPANTPIYLLNRDYFLWMEGDRWRDDQVQHFVGHHTTPLEFNRIKPDVLKTTGTGNTWRRKTTRST